MGRNNVQDNFEQCYLRENSARAAFAKKEEVDKLLSDKDFNRCVSHVARTTFSKNRDVLMRHGFDLEDMMSIARILALQFVNSSFEGRTKKDDNYVMMYGLNQRLNNFYSFLDHKFRVSENHLDLSLDDLYSSFIEEGKDYPIESSSSVPESVYVESGWVKEAKLKSLRVLLRDNIDDYREKLAELATSKLAEHDVRKKARSVCRQYGIDYAAWAKEQIRRRSLSVHDFVL